VMPERDWMRRHVAMIADVMRETEKATNGRPKTEP